MNVEPSPTPPLSALTLPPHDFNQLFADVQAQPRAFVPPGQPRFDLAESLEQSGHVFRIDSYSRIDDAYDHPVARQSGFQSNRPPFREFSPRC